MKNKMIKTLSLMMVFTIMGLMTQNIVSFAQSMSISQSGIEMIKTLEGGFRSTAYKVVDTEKYYTIGYGHYGSDVTAGMTITEARAEELLRKDISSAVNSVNTFLNNNQIWLTQNQFDALVSFTYNCGNVWIRTAPFDLRDYLKNGISNYSNAEIRAAFTVWNKSGGKVLDGLTNRRNKEADLFLKDRTSSGSTAPYATGPLYIQSDAKWANYTHGTGTLQFSGCGIFALVNAVYALTGNDMGVVNVADWAHSIGAYNSGNSKEGTRRNELYPNVTAKYGAQYKFSVTNTGTYGNSSSSGLINHLQNGGVAIGHVENHFMALVGYSDGKILVYDSAPSSERGTTRNGDWKTAAELTVGKANLDWYCLISSSEPTPKPTPRYQPDPSQYKVSYSRALYYKDGWTESSTMHGNDVKYIQVCLYYLGYDLDTDGWFGPGTRAVVKAFQQHYGLEADGACGPATWPVIEKAVADNPSDQPPTAVNLSINQTQFKVGDYAVFSFSSNNNPAGFEIQITHEGTAYPMETILDSQTYKFECKYAGKYEAYVRAWNYFGGCNSNIVSFNVESDDISEKPTPRYEPDTSQYRASYSRALYYKDGWTESSTMHGDDVKYIQVCLYYLGYNLDTDGWFGPGTRAVVKAFQQHHGLEADGSCGPATWPVIEKAVADNPSPNLSTYTVTYNANGGSGAPSAQTKKHGTTLTLSSAKPTRSGYTFMGWAESAGAANAKYQAGASFTDNKNVTLYAVWKQVTLSSVTIKKLPTKKTYTVGEKFDPTGMIVKLTYSDGSTKEITSGYTYTPMGAMNTVGQQTIAVAYQGKGTGFKVTVEPSLNSISIKAKPSKLTYTVGETLNTSGLKLTATYSDGTTKEITSGFTCTPTKLSTKGQQLITLKYGNVSTSFYVTVNGAGVKQIRVTQRPTKTTYATGNTLNTSGMKVTVTYTDGSTKVITSGFTCTPTKLETVGTQWITVKYGGTATAFNVKVEQRAQSIRVITKPSKTAYVVGNTLNTSGMKVRATYSDGTTKDVTSGFTCTPTKLTTAGNQWITVVYAGQSTAFSVKVEPKAKTLRISQQPTKKTYTVGDVLNTSGLQLIATYDDGTAKVVTSGFVCSPVVLNTAGNQWITVIYGGQSTAYSVKVTKAVSNVTIANKPNKQTYTVGDTFAPAGMKLKVTYSDNTTEVITSGYTYTPTGKLNTEGQQKIVVSYGGKSTGFYVTVNKPSGNTVTSVLIGKLPTKKTYKRGETFDPTGMTVKVTYADGTTSVMAGGYTYTPSAPLTKAGQQVITVGYGGKYTGFKVTVE